LVNDVERLAAALRIANEELEVKSADLNEAAEHGRRRLIRRLLYVGLLSAVGATLLLTGGLAAPAAIKRIRNQSDSDSGHKTTGENEHQAKGDNNGENGNGAQAQGGHGQSSGNGGKGGSKKPHPKVKEKEKEEEKDLPNLIVSQLTPTEVVVENLSAVNTGSFSVKVVGETAERRQIQELISFPEGLGAGEEVGRPLATEIECSGAVFAEADYLGKIKESDEYDNELSTCTSPEEPGKKGETEEGQRETPKPSEEGSAAKPAATGGATATTAPTEP
jgi:hypothetical protein